MSTITGTDSANVLTGTNSREAIHGLGGDDTLYGLGGDDVLIGGLGDDVLDGGIGADKMYGGLGDDIYYVDDAGDRVIEDLGAGTDTVIASVDFSLAGQYIEDLTLAGTGDIKGTGNHLDNILVGNSGANLLDGGLGADIMQGGAGNDTYIVDNAGDEALEADGQGIDLVASSVSFSLSGQYLENLTLTGSADIDATGNSLANGLTGNSGDNTLDGGTAADTMQGGQGDDTYIVDNIGDQIVEADGEGTDLVRSAVTFSLDGTYVENLTLTGSASVDGTGNQLNNVITGNSGANELSGGEGDDRFDGAGGADTLVGGLGNDTYVLDNTNDQVVELAGQGTDTIAVARNFSLAGLQIENLTLLGVVGYTATGNSFSNVLIGNAGANLLDGASGADTMQGGAGNDTYVVDNAGDRVIEADGNGTDLVNSSVTFSLGGQFADNLTLTGSANVNATGNSLANTIIGNSGNNLIYGASGADTMQGGSGNDTYVVDNPGDRATEETGGGTDLVKSSVTFSLGDQLENLTLIGSLNVSATGNSLANTIVGNSGDNQIDGGSGADTMRGGSGDDDYTVDNAGDRVIEADGGGTDTVTTSLTFSLGGLYVENLTLTGSADIRATGNHLDNTIIGNSGMNLIDGGAGADTMQGGSGNDFYTVDNSGDLVIEENGGGNDGVNSSVTFSLSGQEVEFLILTGSDDIDATGSEFNNSILGNSGDNQVDGGGGNDTMDGSIGADTFLFSTALNAATNVDHIEDFASEDTIELENSIFTALTTAGTLAASAFVSGAGLTAAQDASDRVVYDTTTGALFYDSDGAGGAAAVQFAVLDHDATLTNADILVI